MASNEIIVANKDLPSELLIIPMAGKPLFPGIFTPILINEAEDIALVERAYEGDRTIGLVLTRETSDETSHPKKDSQKKQSAKRGKPEPKPERKDDDYENPSEDLEQPEEEDSAAESADSLEYEESQELYDVGTIARISRKINLPDGNINIFITTLKRFRIKSLNSDTYPLVAEVEYLDDVFPEETDELKGLTRALLSEMKRLAENNPLFTEEMRLNMVNIDSPGTIADFTASILNLRAMYNKKS